MACLCGLSAPMSWHGERRELRCVRVGSSFLIEFKGRNEVLWEILGRPDGKSGSFPGVLSVFSKRI